MTTQALPENCCSLAKAAVCWWQPGFLWSVWKPDVGHESGKQACGFPKTSSIWVTCCSDVSVNIGSCEGCEVSVSRKEKDFSTIISHMVSQSTTQYGFVKLYMRWSDEKRCFLHYMAATDSPSSCNFLKNLLRIEWQRFFVTNTLENLKSNSGNVYRGLWSDQTWIFLLVSFFCSPYVFSSAKPIMLISCRFAYFRIGLPHPVGEGSSTSSHRWSYLEDQWHRLVTTITNVQSEAGFFDRMLHTFAKHSGCSLIVECSGDLHVHDHHTLEDVGTSLYLTFLEVLRQVKGVKRLHQAL